MSERRNRPASGSLVALALVAMCCLSFGMLNATDFPKDPIDPIGDPTPSPTVVPPSPSPTPTPCRECPDGYTPASSYTTYSGCPSNPTTVGEWAPRQAICGAGNGLYVYFQFENHDQCLSCNETQFRAATFSVLEADYRNDVDYCINNSASTDFVILDTCYYFAWDLPSGKTESGVGRSSVSDVVEMGYNQEYRKLDNVTVSVSDKTCGCDPVNGTDVADDAGDFTVSCPVILYREEITAQQSRDDMQPTEYHGWTRSFLWGDKEYDGVVYTEYSWEHLNKPLIGKECGASPGEYSESFGEEWSISGSGEVEFFKGVAAKLGISYSESHSLTLTKTIDGLDGLIRNADGVSEIGTTTFNGKVTDYGAEVIIPKVTTEHWKFYTGASSVSVKNYPCAGASCQ